MYLFLINCQIVYLTNCAIFEKAFVKDDTMSTLNGYILLLLIVPWRYSHALHSINDVFSVW